MVLREFLLWIEEVSIVAYVLEKSLLELVEVGWIGYIWELILSSLSRRDEQVILRRW